MIDWTGDLDVLELAALIERADVFVGADSGPAHLAAAVGRPSVVLFSGTNNAGQWRPQGLQVTVLKNEVACSPCHRETCPLVDHPCLEGLFPAAVMHAVCSHLSQTVGERTIVRVDVPHAAKSRSGPHFKLERIHT